MVHTLFSSDEGSNEEQDGMVEFRGEKMCKNCFLDQNINTIEWETETEESRISRLSQWMYKKENYVISIIILGSVLLGYYFFLLWKPILEYETHDLADRLELK